MRNQKEKFWLNFIKSYWRAKPYFSTLNENASSCSIFKVLGYKIRLIRLLNVNTTPPCWCYLAHVWKWGALHTRFRGFTLTKNIYFKIQTITVTLCFATRLLKIKNKDVQSRRGEGGTIGEIWKISVARRRNVRLPMSLWYIVASKMNQVPSSWHITPSAALDSITWTKQN